MGVLLVLRMFPAMCLCCRRRFSYSIMLTWTLARQSDLRSLLGGEGCVELLLDWLVMCLLSSPDASQTHMALATSLQLPTLLGSHSPPSALFPKKPPTPPPPPQEAPDGSDTETAEGGDAVTESQVIMTDCQTAQLGMSVVSGSVGMHVEVVSGDISVPSRLPSSLSKLGDLPEDVPKQLATEAQAVPKLLHYLSAALWSLCTDEANAMRLVERQGLPLLVGVLFMASPEEEYVSLYRCDCVVDSSC